MARNNVQYVSFYTDGSAARKITPTFSAAKATLPKPKRRKRRVVCIDPVAILGIAVAVCMLATMAVGLVQFKAAQADALAMEKYAKQLSAENAALSEEYSSGYDLEEVEKTALALGMVPQDQVQQTTITVTVPQEEEQLTLWERIGTFLSGLFA